MAGNVHKRNVLNLYRIILRLHEQLPIDLKTLGDLYVKSEFRLHKNCSSDIVPQFMQQWTVYARNLHQQLDSQSLDIGDNLSLENIDSLSEDQILQLIELMKETTKVNKQFNIQDKE